MEFTEKQIKDTMADLDCTREEAIDCLTIEANMIKPKSHTVAPTEKKAKKPREIKIDDEKVEIIKKLFEFIDYEDKAIVNPQKEITFKLNGSDYSISLIKHRPKKL